MGFFKWVLGEKPGGFFRVGWVFSNVVHMTLLEDRTVVFLWFLGTPNESNWPGVSKLPDYKSTFPNWKTGKLDHVVPQLNNDGLDLVHVSFITLSYYHGYFQFFS